MVPTGQRILGAVILAAGVLYGAAILHGAYRERESLRSGPALGLIAALEAAVYFCASMGVSDFLLNTMIAQRLRLTNDKTLPGTVVACCLTPGAVTAFFLLRSENPVDLLTVVLCGAMVMAGSMTGSRLVSRFAPRVVETVRRTALIVSLLVLIGKIIISAGRTGEAMGLSSWKLAVAAVVCFAAGALNMFGIPMKPTWTAMFLAFGMSPLATLTTVLVLGALSPFSGGLEVVRRGNYNRKMASCGVLAGSVGVILGVLLAVSLPAALLNVLLIVVMLLAIITAFRR